MTRLRDHILAEMLPDGRRLHLRSGPIDLVIEANGEPGEVAAAYTQAEAALPPILPSLMAEIDLLRAPISSTTPPPEGKIARAMFAAAARHAGFVTPMIAVAGAVADHMLAALLKGRRLERAYVNNGGDIALHLSPGTHFDVGVCDDPSTGDIGSVVRIRDSDAVRGIATSGWRGRSHSLGIADAVTVLTRSAAEADAAATLIANAVDLPGHPGIIRRPANTLSPDSDLGARLVTVDVPRLTDAEKRAALTAGHRLADQMIAKGHIIAAYGSLQGAQFVTDRHAPGIDPMACASSHGPGERGLLHA